MPSDSWRISTLPTRTTSLAMGLPHGDPTPPARRWERLPSESRHDAGREVFDDAVLPAQRRVEHDLREPLPLELSHLLAELRRRAREAAGANQLRGDEARLLR